MDRVYWAVLLTLTSDIHIKEESIIAEQLGLPFDKGARDGKIASTQRFLDHVNPIHSSRWYHRWILPSIYFLAWSRESVQSVPELIVFFFFLSLYPKDICIYIYLSSFLILQRRRSVLTSIMFLTHLAIINGNTKVVVKR